MFYRLIEKKRDQWYASQDCTVGDIIRYVNDRGMMRDAQVEAIKTYLYLKVACHNAPLWKLFVEGAFNTIDLEAVALSVAARQTLTENKAAAALFEYACLKDRNGRQLAPELERFIKSNPEKIDYEATFKKIFYGVGYTDYLFSLPMGAGKTFLMAAFIYLDLYFALNEPSNRAFAHNFIVLAPSGLKSSILPSLKHIKEFDSSWIIPEPTASQLKRLVKFEVLDEHKSAKKSNIVRNPNAQKINNHQPLEDLVGLVAVTNAEKVILDRIDENEDQGFYSKEEWQKIRLANELREIIGKIPQLAIFIDEVHHAADSDIKLRQVVSSWTKEYSFCNVLGFSGTPYLEKAESVALADSFVIKNTDLSNVVYHYPLVDGVGNFLKVPQVRFADNDTEAIVRNGVRDFLDKYKDTVYADGTCAKLAIYCGLIDTLEEQIYPQVAQLLSEYGLNPSEALLKYHGGNNAYPKPEGSETEFASLDTNLSKIRVVLLVQIGKEGWDCKSLTGVVLPHKGVCPTNMVLQTSCRCLRQVVRHEEETALIWLNQFNADKLNKQLKQQQNISLQELNDAQSKKSFSIERFSRMKKLNVPPIDFYQLKVSYQTLIVEKDQHTREKLETEKVLCKSVETVIHEQDFSGTITNHYLEEKEKEGSFVSFKQWLCLIAKESFNTLPVNELEAYEERLRLIFDHITIKDADGQPHYDVRFDQDEIRSLIRKAFVPKRSFTVKEEVVPRKASLLQIEKLTSPLSVADEKPFYPSQDKVKEVVDWDENAQGKKLTAEQLALLEQMRKMGYRVPEPNDPNPERVQTYHYLPYRFDSGLEKEYFAMSLLPIIKGKKLEAYFNGDDNLTNFKIDCYKRKGHGWQYIGKYVPDFLLLSRDADGGIHKIIIIETKGEVYADKFADRRKFMETEFVSRNNESFGYDRFRFLYLEDTLKKDERERMTLDAIDDFFQEK